jgi:hypothetical protein
MILVRGRLFLEAAGAAWQDVDEADGETARMLAIECGTCRSGRTGTARLEAAG